MSHKMLFSYNIRRKNAYCIGHYKFTFRSVRKLIKFRCTYTSWMIDVSNRTEKQKIIKKSSFVFFFSSCRAQIFRQELVSERLHSKFHILLSIWTIGFFRFSIRKKTGN